MNTIVFSRIWNPAHIKTALLCARKHAPDCCVVHLHCKNSSVGWDDAFDMTDLYDRSMDYLGTANRIWGHGDKAFQKVNVARWAVLRRWMEDSGLDEVCHCDSDVLLFDDPFKSPHYEPGKLHVSSNHEGMVHAGHSIVNRAALDAFCADVQVKMEDKTTPDNIVNDMGIWSDVAEKIGYVDQNQVIDGVAFDHHLGFTDGWGSNDGWKKLEWRDGRPFGYFNPWLANFRPEIGSRLSALSIRLLNLHCWNETEESMEEYARLGGVEV